MHPKRTDKVRWQNYGLREYEWMSECLEWMQVI